MIIEIIDFLGWAISIFFSNNMMCLENKKHEFAKKEMALLATDYICLDFAVGEFC